MKKTPTMSSRSRMRVRDLLLFVFSVFSKKQPAAAGFSRMRDQHDRYPFHQPVRLGLPYRFPFHAAKASGTATGLHILALLLECCAPSCVAGREAFAGKGER